MANLEWLTHDQFVGRVGERFDVAAGDEPALRLELIETAESTESGGPGPDGQERLQFSLVFRGDATLALPQGTYRLDHPELGELDLFLVPIGPDDQGMRYEAAFA